MRNIAIAAALAVSVAACSPAAQNETAEAGNAVATDVEETTSEAVDDVDAATDSALAGAENAMDATGNALGNAGAATETEAERLRRATGEAMTDTGNTMKR